MFFIISSPYKSQSLTYKSLQIFIFVAGNKNRQPLIPRLFNNSSWHFAANGSFSVDSITVRGGHQSCIFSRFTAPPGIPLGSAPPRPRAGWFPPRPLPPPPARLSLLRAFAGLQHLQVCLCNSRLVLLPSLCCQSSTVGRRTHLVGWPWPCCLGLVSRCWWK